jgi:hypothetical protein
MTVSTVTMATAATMGMTAACVAVRAPSCSHGTARAIVGS